MKNPGCPKPFCTAEGRADALGKRVRGTVGRARDGVRADLPLHDPPVMLVGGDHILAPLIPDVALL